MAPECGSSSVDKAKQVVELDLRDQKCPLPVLRARKALRRAAPGATIVLYCTDPLAAIDIPHLVRSEGHRLASQSKAGSVTIFRIVKEQSTSARR